MRAREILSEVAHSVESWRITGLCGCQIFQTRLKSASEEPYRGEGSPETRRLPSLFSACVAENYLRRCLPGRAWRDCGIRPNRTSCLSRSSQACTASDSKVELSAGM